MPIVEVLADMGGVTLTDAKDIREFDKISAYYRPIRELKGSSTSLPEIQVDGKPLSSIQLRAEWRHRVGEIRGATYKSLLPHDASSVINDFVKRMELAI